MFLRVLEGVWYALAPYFVVLREYEFFVPVRLVDIFDLDREWRL